MTTTNLNNGKINKLFLLTLDQRLYNEIVGSMANHYGISINEAADELFDEEAENILEYLQGNIRSACNVLFQKWKLSINK